jgi:hypothetical protein
VQASHQQLEVLALLIAQLLQTLDGEYHAGRLLQTDTSTPLADLCRFVSFSVSLNLPHTSIMQIAGRGLGFHPERGIGWIFKATFHQRS